MAADKPQSRPEPPQPAPGKPSVYGGQWGSSGKQNQDEDKGHKDRPAPIKTPSEPEGEPGES